MKGRLKMGKHNYHNFSGHFNKPENNVVTKEELNPLATVAEETVEEVFDNVIEEVINEEPIIEEVKGYLTNCSKLNVRATAAKDANVLCILDRDDEVKVVLDNNTSEFYKICTSAGVEGYCMKQFIAVK